MAEYYSSALRDMAKNLNSDDPQVVFSIYANIAQGAANRIDDLQHELGQRIIQIARLRDEIQRMKNVQVRIES